MKFSSGLRADLQLVFEPEDAHHVVDEGDDGVDLVVELVLPAKDVGVVLGELPHPQKAVEHAGLLVPVHRAQLEVAQGQVPVAPDLRFVDHDVGEAVHGLQPVLDLVHLREVHVLPVVLVVAGLLPQVHLEYLRADDELVAPLQVLLFLEVFEDVAEQGAVRVVDHETRADLVGDAEEVELLAEPPVVPLLHFFKEVEVLLEGLGARKSRPVNPREHLVLFVAPPVRAGKAEELEGRYLSRRGEVGTAAEVGKAVLRVQAHLLVLYAADQFHLEGLAHAAKEARLPHPWALPAARKGCFYR